MLTECAVYMSSINGKSLSKNYNNLVKHILEDKVNLSMLRSLLMESLETDPKHIQNLYDRLKKKFNKLKSNKDPKVNAMIRDIVEKATKDNFNTELRSLLMYLIQIGDLKQNKYTSIYTSCMTIYKKCISKGKTHKESALRALISIPLIETPKIFSMKNILKVILPISFIALIGIMCVSSPRHGIILLVGLLVYFISGGQYMVYMI